METSSFTTIDIDSDATIEIRYSPSAKIQSSGSMDDLKSMVSTSANRLNLKGGDSNSKMRIYTRSLNAIKVSGNANVTVEGFSSIDKLTVMTDENAKLDLGSTKINDLSINQNGNSSVNSTGAATTMLIKDGNMVTMN